MGQAVRASSCILSNQGEELRFASLCNDGKPLEGFKQESDMLFFVFEQDHSGCYANTTLRR